MGTKIHEVLRGVAIRVLMVIDIGLLMLSFGLAAVLSANTNKWAALTDFLATRVSLLNCVLLAIALLLGHGVLVMCNLYESKRMSPKSAEGFDILRAMTFLTACIWCEMSLFHASRMRSYFLLAFWAIGTMAIISARLWLRSVLAAIRKRGGNLHHVLILGTNVRAVGFGRMIDSAPELGCRVLGFVDDDWSGMENFKQTGFPLVCDYEGLPEYLRKNVVDEIAMYLPLRSFYERSERFARLAKQHGILVRLDTDVFDLKFVRRHAEDTGGLPQIVASNNSIDGWQLLIKRIVDSVGSLALLILFSPLFLIVTILVKLTSSGPVIFAQTRVGLNKRQFTMYKFRTMVPGADLIQKQFAHLNEMTGPVFKIKNDPRVTPIGRILRKTSIDELPQLFNVLKGDMSLVGPRALPVRDYECFREDWHRRRFSVPPGITCLWQVHGRNSISFEQWMLLDMQYIDRWSLWLDLKILALTIPAVFKGSGEA
jgi:exopolysaccharide biosynthesis polyprenyl glycosylphosphotransferase